VKDIGLLPKNGLAHNVIQGRSSFGEQQAYDTSTVKIGLVKCCPM